MDYGRRARVENTIHRYKAIIGNKLRSKNLENQYTEIQIGVQILNRMAQLWIHAVRGERKPQLLDLLNSLKAI